MHGSLNDIESSLEKQTQPAAEGRWRFLGLLSVAAATVVLWQIPGGNYILYPFTILATWFHEMAHGMAAVLMGGNFTGLMIFSDGSGLATYTDPLGFGPVGRAFVAAAGPMGPPLAGAAFILVSKSPKATSFALTFLGAFLLISTAVWVRSLFGVVAIVFLGIGILGIALKGTANIRKLAVQFLGVQACISTYVQIDYLFSYSAGPLGISDTAQIQQALWLPYWFWGGVIAVSSFGILVQSLRVVYRP